METVNGTFGPANKLQVVERDKMWTQNIPKIELHCHLDGSIPLSVIKKLCQKEKIAIPGSERAFRKLVEADENCESLCEYLEAFKLPLSCLTTEESFYEAAYAEAMEASKEGVLYQELRFSPLLSEKPGLSSESIIEAVIEGLAKAKEEAAAIMKQAMETSFAEESLKKAIIAKLWSD